MKDLQNDLADYSQKIYKNLKDYLQKADRDDIAQADGRLETGHEGAKKGSFVYILYDKCDNVLYVGETSTTIKNRLKGDGSGSHFVKNPQMFNETSYVKYLMTVKEDELSDSERKMIEQALSIYLKPRYYNGKQGSFGAAQPSGRPFILK